MYGTTKHKITHVVNDSRGIGWDGFARTICGKWIITDRLLRDSPEGTRMCKLCAKKEAANARND